MVWGEGLRFRDSALWLSDTQGSRLWTDSSGRWTPFELDSPSNGLWFLPDGSLVGALMHERKVGMWDGNRWRTYADLEKVAIGPLGDMVGDSRGNLYVDDVGFNAGAGEQPVAGRVLLVRPDGTSLVVASELLMPNGLVLVDGGQTLLVVETVGQRIVAFDVNADGSLGGRRLYADLAVLIGPDVKPDGACTAADDGIWVADLNGCVMAKVIEGSVVRTTSTAPKHPISCCVRDDGMLIVAAATLPDLPLHDALRSGQVRASLVEAGSA